jgi:hypothetical protein
MQPHGQINLEFKQTKSENNHKYIALFNKESSNKV